MTQNRWSDSRPRVLLARWTPMLLSVGLLVTCTWMAVRTVTARTGGQFVYSLDDAYIHMGMAKNLATHGIWGCTPFRFGVASSSPLWTLALAAVYAVAGVRDVVPLLLNMLFSVVTLYAADLALRRYDAPLLVRAATLVGLVLVFPMTVMGIMGMEHVLHLLLTLVFAGAATQALARPTSAAAPAGETALLSVLAALLAASRYEGLFPIALVCLGCVAVGRWRQALTIGASGAAPLVLLGLVSLSQGAFFLPNPLMLKGGGEHASTWTILFRPIGRAELEALRKNPPLMALLAAAVAMLALALGRHRRVRHAAVLLPLLLLLLVCLHVHFELSSPFWVYRYDAYLLGLGVFTAGVTVSDALPRFGPRWAPGLPQAAAVVGLVLALGDPRYAVQPVAETDLTWITYREHHQIARFVRETFPSSTIVVNDVGVLGYASESNMLDMFGLCDIEPILFRRRFGHYTKTDVSVWTDAYLPDIAIVQLNWGWVPPQIPVHWRKAAEVAILPERRRIGFYAIGEDVDSQVLGDQVARFYAAMAPDMGYHVAR